jgi:hypothetical protein
VPAQQGPEAVLSSLAPLCASSALDHHKLLAAWLRAEGAAGLVQRQLPSPGQSNPAAVFDKNF